LGQFASLFSTHCTGGRCRCLSRRREAASPQAGEERASDAARFAGHATIRAGGRVAAIAALLRFLRHCGGGIKPADSAVYGWRCRCASTASCVGAALSRRSQPRVVNAVSAGHCTRSVARAQRCVLTSDLHTILPPTHTGWTRTCGGHQSDQTSCTASFAGS
jgi:hypothetical protein